MAVYYPAMAVNLVMRFDESLLTGALLKPDSAESLAKAKTSFLGAGTSAKPSALDGTKDRLSHILSIIPKQGSLELPGYRQAGKFSLSFAWRDLPIDPRAIRALGVEIYIGTVSALNFARGMRGEKDNGQLASYIVQNAQNLMLAGIADNHTVTFNDRGSEVKIDGRDLRSIFIDGKIAPETVKQVKVDQPINKVVQDILNRAPQGANINVNIDPNDWPNGVVPSPADPRLVSRISLGANGQKPGHMPVKGSSVTLNFWDIITNFCLLVGAVPYFRGYDLWIRPARSLFDQAKAEGPNRNPTPFKDGLKRAIPLAGGKSEDIAFRRMVYGSNISSLNFERKLAGASKVPTVKCVSVDPSQPGEDKLIEGEWPKADKAKVTNVSPSGNESGQEILRIPVPGITDKSRLEQIAEQIYEEIGRGELGGSCSSKDLASLGGDNEDADIVRLRPGDAVEFLVDATGVRGLPPVVSQLNNTAAQSTQEAAKELTEILGGQRYSDLANVLVGTARGTIQNLQSVFRVANVKYSWAAESGIGVDFDFQNYIEARYDTNPTINQITNNLLNAGLKLKERAEAERKNPSRAASQKRGG